MYMSYFSPRKPAAKAGETSVKYNFLTLSKVLLQSCLNFLKYNTTKKLPNLGIFKNNFILILQYDNNVKRLETTIIPEYLY